MSMVGVSFSKRDLKWIVPLVLILVIGFGMSLNSGNYLVHGHDAGEIEGGGGASCSTYDSGWILMALGDLKTVTHNLGDSLVDVQVYVASNNGGSPDLNTVRIGMQSNVNTNSVRALFDYQVNNMQDNSFDLQGGWAYVGPTCTSGTCDDIYVPVYMRAVVTSGSCTDTSINGFSPSTYTGGESVTFPNGMIMKTGSVADTSGSGSVSFGSDFPNGIVSLQMTVIRSVEATSAPSYDSLTISGFKWHKGTASLPGFSWTATGY